MTSTNMDSFERNSSGVIATSIFMGLGTGTLITLLYQALFDRGFGTGDLISLAFSGLGPLYFCAVLFWPWFSDPEMRPFRHMGLLMLAVIQLIIWLVDSDSFLSCVAFGSVHLIFYFVYIIFPGVQPFKKSKGQMSEVYGAPHSVTVTMPSTPVFVPSVSPNMPVYSQPPPFHPPYPVKN